MIYKMVTSCCLNDNKICLNYDYNNTITFLLLLLLIETLPHKENWRGIY